MDEPRACPYCAETIRPAATRCPHCRSWLGDVDPATWYRDRPERRLAGVAAATAHGLGIPLAAVRIGFLALTFFHFLGPILYGALWLLVPAMPGGRTPFERGVGCARSALGHLGGTPPRADHGPGSRP